MTKVTIVKNYRNTETLKPTDLERVVNSIQQCEYDEEVSIIRRVETFVDLKRKDDGSMDGAPDITSKLPRDCFASEL